MTPVIVELILSTYDSKLPNIRLTNTSNSYTVRRIESNSETLSAEHSNIRVPLRITACARRKAATNFLTGLPFFVSRVCLLLKSVHHCTYQRGKNVQLHLSGVYPYASS